jgi:hypothetical protein
MTHATQTRHPVKRVPVVIGTAVVLIIAVLALPIKQRCGAPGNLCASVVDARGNVHHYYEVEPLGVFFAEVITGSNISIYYTSGEEVETVR